MHISPNYGLGGILDLCFLGAFFFFGGGVGFLFLCALTGDAEIFASV